MLNTAEIEQSFLVAYEKYADAIYRHCFFRVHHKEKAEDLMQEAFTRTWKYCSENGIPENIRAFLYRVATNLIIDEARKKKESFSLDALVEAGHEPGFDTRERLVDHLDGKAVIAKLDRLEPNHREVIIMRYLEGLKPKEIAHLLEETQNVISVRLHRAKKQLAALV